MSIISNLNAVLINVYDFLKERYPNEENSLVEYSGAFGRAMERYCGGPGPFKVEKFELSKNFHANTLCRIKVTGGRYTEFRFDYENETLNIVKYL